MHRAASLNPKDFGPELPRIEQIVTAATKGNVRVPIEDVKAIGKNAIEASNDNTQQASLAWRVVLDLASYRSFLNITYKPNAPIVPLPVSGEWKYHGESPKGKLPPELAYTPQAGVPSKQAARYNLIGVDENRNLPHGPALLFLKGGSVVLDGYEIKNAIIVGVEIHYSAGQVILENVIFINCTFVMDNTDPCRRLGEEMLASANIDFRNT
jgi:hypothetical protein